MAIQAPITPAHAGERGRLRKPQPGPVTLAIRTLRRNEAPSWEMGQRQINEEREALRALRKRIQDQIDADLTRVDLCLHALDLMDGDADIEPDAGEEPEGAFPYSNLDDEPSLGGLTAERMTQFGASGITDGEICAGDEPEHDDAEISGIGDEEGYAEQFPFLHSGFGAYA